MSDDSTDAEYGLVYPFTVCQSNGGPYEDRAFVAGFQAGQVDATLKAAAAIGATAVRFPMLHSALVPQVELIAMHHGFPTVSAEIPDEHPDWADVTVRQEPTA